MRLYLRLLMIKLKVIAFFLSLLIAMQMLPIKQIGKVLASNQWTEELPHDADETGKDASVKFNHPFLPPANYTTSVSFASDSKALAYIHLSEQIPSNHSTEVVTPPPDSVC
ncbi:MAG: hypothetical protein JWQ09_2617 [Segetibacter sp.]|nr:hypothetical protein [Segetibacter sp.]